MPVRERQVGIAQQYHMQFNSPIGPVYETLRKKNTQNKEQVCAEKLQSACETEKICTWNLIKTK